MTLPPEWKQAALGYVYCGGAPGRTAAGFVFVNRLTGKYQVRGRYYDNLYVAMAAALGYTVALRADGRGFGVSYSHALWQPGHCYIGWGFPSDMAAARWALYHGPHVHDGGSPPSAPQGDDADGCAAGRGDAPDRDSSETVDGGGDSGMVPAAAVAIDRRHAMALWLRRSDFDHIVDLVMGEADLPTDEELAEELTAYIAEYDAAGSR